MAEFSDRVQGLYISQLICMLRGSDLDRPVNTSLPKTLLFHLDANHVKPYLGTLKPYSKSNTLTKI